MKERRRVLEGTVTSNRMLKTVVVVVERLQPHPLYGKVLRRVKKYKAHDENNSCQIGDRVRIIESRALSKEKHWLVTDIISRSQVVEAVKDLEEGVGQ